MKTNLFHQYVGAKKKVPKSRIFFFILLTLSTLQTSCKSSVTETPTASGGGGTTTPSPITSSPVNAKHTAVGADKAFGIKSQTAQAWGSDFEYSNGVYGQLGLNLGTNTVKSSPQTLDSGTSFLSITSGEMQSCGITSNSKIKCWGSYVGDGTNAGRLVPTFINDGGTKTYTDVASGSYHNCAIDSTGALSCWGDGYLGKLGNGDGSGLTQDSPVPADSGTLYKRVSGGRNHSCGITSNNDLKCWGDNGSGQAGPGADPQLTPTIVDAGVKYLEISAGEDTNCAITVAGVLKCWGANGNGQIGDNSTTNRPLPVVIDAGTTYSKVAVGGSYYYHTCAITTTGVLKCWGDNSLGQVGPGAGSGSLLPLVVDSGVSYREVAVNFGASCAITTGGLLKCWGKNNSGQLGAGDTATHTGLITVGTGY